MASVSKAFGPKATVAVPPFNANDFAPTFVFHVMVSPPIFVAFLNEPVVPATENTLPVPESTRSGRWYSIAADNSTVEFVAFPSIAFAGESKRADAVRTRGDFVGIIGKYLDSNDLTFGNVYSGDEWSDPNWFMD